MKHKKLLFLAVASTALYGCSSEAEIVSEQEKTNPYSSLEDELMESNCLKKYEIAFMECADFVKSERNPYLRDKFMRQCLSNKGFAAGPDSCKGLSSRSLEQK